MSLTFPAVLWGPRAQVTRALKPRLAQLLRGAPWAELWGPEALAVDTTAGLVVLNGPAPLLAQDPHFQAYLPLQLLLQNPKATPAQRLKAAQAALTTPWGVLGVLAPANLILVLSPELHLPLAQATWAFWGLLTGCTRYSVGLNQGQSFATITHNLYPVLARLGVPEATLNGPQTEVSLGALLAATLSR